MPQGPGFLFTFVYYTVMATVVATFSSAPLLFGGRLGLEAIETALPIGLVLGLLGAYFNRTASLELTVRSGNDVQTQLEQLLTSWEFVTVDPTTVLGDRTGIQVYERASWRKWFSGRVFVRIERQTATVVSRAGLIRKLERQLGAVL